MIIIRQLQLINYDGSNKISSFRPA